jgi:hypothetical protein
VVAEREHRAGRLATPSEPVQENAPPPLFRIPNCAQAKNELPSGLKTANSRSTTARSLIARPGG